MSYEFELSNTDSGLVTIGTPFLIADYPFSVCVKFKAESVSGNQGLVCAAKTSNDTPYLRMYYTSAGALVVECRFSGGTRTSNPAGTVTADGNWHMLTMSAASRTSLTGYYDTTAGTTATTDVPFNPSGDADAWDRWAVGAWNRNAGAGGLQYHADARIAEVAIWLYGLSAGDVSDLYSGAAANTIGSNLVAWWRFNSDEGTTVTDQSSNDNHLTIDGAVYNADHPTIGGGGGGGILLSQIERGRSLGRGLNRGL